MATDSPTGEASVDPGSHIVSTRLFELFREHRSRPFLVVRPTGNAGDSLIWMGAEKLLRIAGVTFEIVSVTDLEPDAIPPDHVVYIHGGGAFVPFWSNTPTIAMAEIAKVHRGHLIYGPSSCVGDADYLQLRLHDALKDSVCETVTLFFRDRTSQSIAAPYVPDHVRTVLDHDSALNLTRSELWEGERSPRYRFYAIRRDAESSAQPVRNPFAFTADPVPDTTGFEHWLRLHAHAREIVTNRLHSSICGSILGIPTTLLPNSYHKNAALWEFSLKERGVVFADEVPRRPLDGFFSATEPVLGLMRGGTGRRLLRLVHGATRTQLFRSSDGRPRGGHPE